MFLSRIGRILIVIFALGISIGLIHAAPRQALRSHVPQAIHESKRLGQHSRTANMDLAIGLPLRNQDELETFNAQVADPASPNFRQFLQTDEFAARFGPSEEDYDKLIAFAQANGLAVSGTHPNRMILNVSGTVPAIERALHITISTYQHPVRGKFIAPDGDPWLDTDVNILDITGLDNFVLPKPMNIQATPLASSMPFTTGSGPGGLFIGKDFRTAYAPGVTVTGTGQTVGLFELDGFYAADVTANFKQAGLTASTVQTVLVDGFSGAAGSANIEVTLDILMAAYMAPGAKIVVYEGTNWNNILNRMATDNTAKQLSSSWAFSPINATTEQIFKQYIAQGQSFFQASGDNGAYHGWIMPPSDNPNVTVVGGTALSTNGAGGAWSSESAWSGSGGGVSTTYAIPSYQAGINMMAIGGSATMRNIPDVALTAAVQMYLIQNNGQAVSVGGTSAAAPLWAGFLALVNQQAAAAGKPMAGFINPAIYALGKSGSYTTEMHDITTGTTGFTAGTGFDLATGWGSPSGQKLIDDLAGTSTAPSFSLAATPGTVTATAGSTVTTSIQLTAKNGFTGATTFSLSGAPQGVTGTFSALTTTGATTLTLTTLSTVASGTYPLVVQGASGTLNATAPLTLSVNGGNGITLTSSASTVSLAQGASNTTNITVNPTGTFAGTVSLVVSGLPAGVTAVFNHASTTTGATLTFTATATAATGTSSITVTGTSGSITAKAIIGLTVTTPPPGFTLAAAPTSMTLPQGSSADTSLTFTPGTGFSGTVNVTVSGLPAGVTAVFRAGKTSFLKTVTFTATSTAATGPATVTFMGTSTNYTATATVALTVIATAGFKLSSSATAANVTPGASMTVPITVTSIGGFTGAVTLAAAGLPAGVTASFSSIGSSGNRTMTLAAASTAAIKATPITITGTSGTLTSAIALTLNVIPPPDFSLTLSPPSLAVVAGQKGSTAILLTPLNGFSGTITPKATGLPTGATATYSAVPGALLMILATAPTTAAGASKVSITLTSGALSHSVTLNLTIVATAAATANVDLSPFYNVSASAVDSVPFTDGGLDALGRSYSGTLLGASQTVNNTLFALGPMGVPDAVSGKTITLPAGKYSALKLLATGVNGNQASQAFIVKYTDGTSTTFTQSLSDWYAPQNYTGETKGASTAYRNNSVGTTDGRPFYTYGYSFALNPAKAVSSVTLPQNRNVVVLGATLTGKTN